MQSDYWNDFCQTGRVSDYLKYVDSSKDTRESNRGVDGRENQSGGMESMHNAGKSNRDGAFGHTGW